MGNLFSALINSSNSLRTFDQALAVVQNNVANASTPGYARQVQSLVANRFEPSEGITGGVSAGELISRRSDYLEDAVRSRQSAVGYAQQRVSDLSQIEPLFSPEAGAGIAGALSNFFQAVSQAGVSPNNTTNRQVVIDRATEVAQSFRDTAAGLGDARADIDRQIGSTVDSVNRLLNQIRDFNVGRASNAAMATDAGVDANLYNTLERLSGLVDFKLIQNSDSTLTVLIGGTEPAVIGEHVFPISDQTSESGVGILSAQGKDLTSTISGGQLGALLTQRNQSLPAYQKDLDTLAASFSSQVNQILSQGLDQNGSTPARDLFVSSDPAHPAATLDTVAGFQTSDLALAYGTAAGNGNALRLSAFQNQNAIDGYTVAEYYGNIGANIGRDLNDAQQMNDTQSSLLTQAQNLREQTQGVSLDEEAATLMTFQRSYEACAKMVKVLDDLTQTTLDLLP
jgi:flagellar hook-associated protein 1